MPQCGCHLLIPPPTRSLHREEPPWLEPAQRPRHRCHWNQRCQACPTDYLLRTLHSRILISDISDPPPVPSIMQQDKLPMLQAALTHVPQQ